MSQTIAAALQWATAHLRNSDSPRLDAELLLCWAMNTQRTTLIAWPDRTLIASQQAAFEWLVNQRESGHPIAHLLGEREFWSLPLKVTRDTLIPRPDTELLVELALERLDGIIRPQIADLGTGTGAIALAVASERPDACVLATDKSDAALVVATENAKQFGLSNLQFVLGDWCEALPKTDRYHLIVSNPPYIRPDDPHLQQGDIRFEPLSALVSGENGLADLATIITGARHHLRDKGWLLLEHGYDQAKSVQTLLRAAGYTKVASAKDLGQNQRASFGQYSQQQTTQPT